MAGVPRTRGFTHYEDRDTRGLAKRSERKLVQSEENIERCARMYEETMDRKDGSTGPTGRTDHLYMDY